MGIKLCLLCHKSSKPSTLFFSLKDVSEPESESEFFFAQTKAKIFVKKATQG
jgi:hypothetical protein